MSLNEEQIQFHREQAEHYQKLIENKDSDPYNSDSRDFHLEKAGEWDRLISSIISIIVNEKQYPVSQVLNIIRLIYHLNNSKRVNDARQWYDKLIAYDYLFETDKTIIKWDFSIDGKNDLSYQNNILRIEKELNQSGDVSLRHSSSVGTRLKTIGDIALFIFNDWINAKRYYQESKKYLEQYTSNVKYHTHQEKNQLLNIYSYLGDFELGRKLYYRMAENNERPNEDNYFHIAIICRILNDGMSETQYYRKTAEKYFEKSSQGYPIWRIYHLAMAGLHYSWSGDINLSNRYCIDALPKLIQLEKNDSKNDWTYPFEYRKILLHLLHREKEAMELTRDGIDRYLSLPDELPGGYNEKNCYYNRVPKQLGLGYSYEYLEDYDKAYEYYQEARKAFEHRLELRTGIWDNVEQVSDYLNGIRYCEALSEKCILKNQIKKNSLNNNILTDGFYLLNDAEQGGMAWGPGLRNWHLKEYLDIIFNFSTDILNHGWTKVNRPNFWMVS